MMNDKTPMYIMMIVGIVALVAIVHMLTIPRANVETNSNPAAGNAITGNVVEEDIAPVHVNLGNVFRFMLGAVLIAASVYMYHKWE